MALACGMVGFALAGCGGGGGHSTSVTTSAFERQQEKAEAEAPKGASPLLRSVYRQFPPPKPDPTVKGSGKAIKKGEAACKGKTPLQVREEFQAEAHLLPEQEEAVKKLPEYEREKGPDFPAGQVAALIYEGTIDRKRLANYGFRGCIYSLARRLEHELSPH